MNLRARRESNERDIAGDLRSDASHAVDFGFDLFATRFEGRDVGVAKRFFGPLRREQ
jgi:hypothetical protein